MRDLELMMRDYRLTTAVILYGMPDYPRVLQTYIWQEFDISPKFPILNDFLAFWESSLHGRLHSVRVASAEVVKPSQYRYVRHLAYKH